MDGGEGREELVAEEPMVGRQVADHGRLDVEAASQVAVGETLAAGEDAAVTARLGHGLLVAVHGRLVGQGSQPVVAQQRVADGDALGLLDQQAHQLVVDRALDVDAAVGRALLAAEAEGRAHDALGGLVEVGAGHDDGRVLAAHLHDAGPRIGRREGALEAHADLVGAREDDAVDGIAGRPARRPRLEPGPMTRLMTPSGTPASR